MKIVTICLMRLKTWEGKDNEGALGNTFEIWD